MKSHINHLFAKIHARSRAEAVRYAYDHGLVTPGPIGGATTRVRSGGPMPVNSFLLIT